jgi:hypothetical protein
MSSRARSKRNTFHPLLYVRADTQSHRTGLTIKTSEQQRPLIPIPIPERPTRRRRRPALALKRKDFI